MSKYFSCFSVFPLKFGKSFLVLVTLLFGMHSFAAKPLDINAATAEELAAVMSGVGLSKAQAIVQYRTQMGDFTSIEELINVRGVGAALLARNRALITVNTSEPDTDVMVSQE